MTTSSHRRLVVLLVLWATVSSACGSAQRAPVTADGTSGTAAESNDAEAATDASDAVNARVAVSLVDICPDPLVIQTDWYPEAEHGALYELVGDDYTVDLDRKTVSGPLVAAGRPTGIDIEIRIGGPAIGFLNPDEQMAIDDNIHIGYTYTYRANNWHTTPLLQVMAPLEKDPQIILWDPETYPDVKTIDDLAAKGVVFNVFSKDALLFFVYDGRIQNFQVDPSYNGTPARFISSNGSIAQQGYASAEPYSYQYEFKGWMKPVAYQLLHDAGYENYTEALGVRPSDLETLRPCLKKFVPMAQQAQVDFVTDPDRTNAMIVDAVKKLGFSWAYSPGLAAFSVKQQLELGLVSNGDNDTLGDFDLDRVQAYLDKMIETGRYTGIPVGFTAEDLVTNEFIDPSIGL